MNKYDVVKTIGEGAYGVVLQCRNKETNELVAIKRFKESDDDELVRKTTLREVRILRLLKDEPYVVHLQEAFRRKGKLYLVFDYVGCNLLDVLEQNPQGLQTEDIRRMVFTMLLGIRACHANGVIHRDIKPENLLVHEDNTLRLCDFGFARIFTQGMDDLTDYVATRWYRSPELLLGTTDYGLPSDIWAVGCIMAELIDGQAIFPCETEVDQIFVIQKLLGNFTAQQMETFRKNPRFNGYTLKELPKAESSLERKFTKKANKKALSLLKQMLVIDPARRCTVDEALAHPFFEGLAEIHYPQLCKTYVAPPMMRPPSASINANSGGANSNKIPALARPASSLAAKQQRVSTPSDSAHHGHQHGEQHGGGGGPLPQHGYGSSYHGHPNTDDGGGEHDGSPPLTGGGARGSSPWGATALQLPRAAGATSSNTANTGGGTTLPPARITSANRHAAMLNDLGGANRVSTPGMTGTTAATGGGGTGGAMHYMGVGGGGIGSNNASTTNLGGMLMGAPGGVQGMLTGSMGMGGGYGGTSTPSQAQILSSTATSYNTMGTMSNAGSFAGRSGAARLPMAPLGSASNTAASTNLGTGNLPRINFTAGFTGANAPQHHQQPIANNNNTNGLTMQQQPTEMYYQQQQAYVQQQMHQQQPPPTTVGGYGGAGLYPPSGPQPMGTAAYAPIAPQHGQPPHGQPAIGGGASNAFGMRQTPTLVGGSTSAGVGATNPYTTATTAMAPPTTGAGNGLLYRTTDLVNGGQLPPRTGGGIGSGGVYSTGNVDPSKYQQQPPPPAGGSAGGYRPRMY